MDVSADGRNWADSGLGHSWRGWLSAHRARGRRDESRCEWLRSTDVGARRPERRHFERSFDLVRCRATARDPRRPVAGATTTLAIHSPAQPFHIVSTTGDRSSTATPRKSTKPSTIARCSGGATNATTRSCVKGLTAPTHTTILRGSLDRSEMPQVQPHGHPSCPAQPPAETPGRHGSECRRRSYEGSAAGTGIGRAWARRESPRHRITGPSSGSRGWRRKQQRWPGPAAKASRSWTTVNAGSRESSRARGCRVRSTSPAGSTTAAPTDSAPSTPRSETATMTASRATTDQLLIAAASTAASASASPSATIVAEPAAPKRNRGAYGVSFDGLTEDGQPAKGITFPRRWTTRACTRTTRSPGRSAPPTSATSRARRSSSRGTSRSRRSGASSPRTSSSASTSAATSASPAARPA